MTIEQFTQHALALPLAERIGLAQTLWQSIQDIEPNESGEAEAISLAKRRQEEIDSGGVECRSHEEVMEAARRALRCQ